MTNGLLKEEESEDRRTYRWSLWWVEHRALVKKVGYGLIMAVEAPLLAFAIWTMIDAFLVSYDREQRAVAEMVAFGQADLSAYTRAEMADSLKVSSAAAIAVGEGKYDLFATVENPNEDWWAEFTYTFSWSGGESASAKGFILPGEEKPVVSFSVASAATPRTPKLELTNIEWRRVDHHLVGDYSLWSADRLDFDIRDIAFTSALAVDSQTVGRVSFAVTNNTAYSYYDPAFFILLKRGPSVIGVNRTTLSSLDSGETRDVAVNWFGTLPSVGSVEVVPEINVFDVGVYKPLAGETTTDTRTRVFPRLR